jgi:predicted amidohydrolase
VLLDAGEEEGLFTCDIDLDAVDEARARVPSLEHDRSFGGL